MREKPLLMRALGQSALTDRAVRADVRAQYVCFRAFGVCVSRGGFFARVRVACEAFRDPSVRKVEGVRSGGRAVTERARHGLTDARVSGHERCSSSAERGTPRRSTRAVARSPLGTAE